MTRARNLANLGNKNALTADIGLFNIGIGSTQPTNYKLEVVGGNAYVGGGLTITGNLSVGGTVTYEDVTNIDAVGIVTAAEGFRATAGGVVVTAGVSTFPVVAVSAGTTTKDLLVTGVTTATGDVSIADKIIHTGDTNTAIRFPAADTITAETAGTERLRITSTGLVGINNNSPATVLDIKSTKNSDGLTVTKGSNVAAFLGHNGSGDEGLLFLKDGGTTNIQIYAESGQVSYFNAGNVGIGTDNPSKPLTIEGTAHSDGILIHAGGNHSTAIDMDSNRSSAAGGLAELNFKWNGTAVGQIGAYAGADTTNKDDGHIHFDTASAGTIIERLRITSTGEIVTQGLTGSSFDNDNANTKVVEITGDGTAGEYGVLNISGNQNANNTTIGALKFINRENSNGSSGGVAGSKNLALISVYSVTSDSNAGDDAGGYMQFATKPESGGVAEAMRIDSSGRVLIGGTSDEGHSNADNLTIASSGNTGITIRAGSTSTANIFFSDATSGTGEYEGMLFYDHNANSMAFATAQNTRLTIDSSGRVLIGTGTSKSVGSGQYAKLNVEGGVGTTENFTSFSRNEAASAMSADDEVANLTFNDSAGYEFARIQVLADAATGATDTPGRISFKTTPDGSSSSSERMRINCKGRVLIGTGAVSATSNLVGEGGLQVSTNGASGAPSLCVGADGTGANAQTLTNNTIKDCRIGYPNYSISEEPLALISGFVGDGSSLDDNDGARIYIGGGTSYLNSVNQIRFYTNNTNISTVTGTERMRITPAGHVQIRYAGSATNGGAPLYVGVTGKSSITYGGGQDDTACLRIEDEGSTNSYYHGLELRTKQGGDARIYAQDKGSDVADLVFATDNSAITERMRLGADGKLGIGVYSANPGCYKGMEVGSATQNAGFSWGGASYNYTNIWAEYGSGDLWLAGGLRGNGTSSGAVSSFSGAVARAAIQIDAFGASGIHFYTATAQTVDRDSAVGLSVPERMRVRENGLVAIGSADDLGNGHAGCLQVINTGSTGQTNDCLSFFETAAADWIIKTNYNRTGNHYHMRFDEEGTLRGEIKGTDGSNVAFTPGSDYRWKENVVDLTGTEGINFCKNLKPRKYNWIDNRTSTGQINTVNGFIAHEVEEAGVGHLVYGEKDAVYEDGSIDGQTLDYAGMTPVLAAAIKGLIDKVETLEAKVAALES